MQRWVPSVAFLLAFGVARAQAQSPETAVPAEPPPSAAAGEAGSSETEPSTPVAGAGEAPAEAEPAAAAEPIAAPRAERPKVAIVVAGDPDDALVAAAHALEDAVRADGRVALPADAAMRAALLGEGMSDGLDDVRASRRRLGRSESADVPVLAELGRLVHAVLVVVVRARDASGVEAVAYDVGQQAFFDGALDLSSANAERAGTFVARRASVAAEGALASAEPVDEGEGEGEPAAPAAGATEAAPVPAGDPVLLWFEQNWAYLAAGALLAGGIAFVAVVLTDAGPPPPMLRFTPGGTTP